MLWEGCLFLLLLPVLLILLRLPKRGRIVPRDLRDRAAAAAVAEGRATIVKIRKYPQD